MTTGSESLLHEALRLPATDRANLAARLIESLDDDQVEPDPDYDAAWAEEVERRIADLAAGRVTTVSLDAVQQEADSHIRDARG